MPRRSALARLQQFTTLATLAAALAWLTWQWGRSPATALIGFLSILLVYSLVLAAEFVALYFVGASDSTPRARAGELLHAWLRETLAAARVFYWRQPFRWRAVPDSVDGPGLQGRRGVVFIHGFVCNRGFWTPWMNAMRARGHAFVAVNLEPVFGSIDDYRATIDAAVTKVTQATGLPPVLVCHSMGGLAARAWLRACPAQARVAHVVTIGTPHRGTWLARFSHLPNGRQMRQGSDWLSALNQPLDAVPGEPVPPVAFTCWYSNCDNIVFPPATATLPGADNRLVRGAAHVDMAFTPEVMAHSLRQLVS